MFFRGFRELMHEQSPLASEDQVEDLKMISRLSDEEVAAVRERLSRAQGFLDPKALLVALREAVQDPKVAAAIRRALLILSPSGAKRMMASLEDERQQEGFPFEEATFGRLKKVLGELIQPYPALARFKKAERLAEITGQQLEAVELVCDLRPIFDENRGKLEGMMPYTRLHIVATGVDGLPKSFEVELTHQQVLDLAGKATKAKSKLEVLRTSVEQWLPGLLPDLPLTRVPQKEANDA